MKFQDFKIEALKTESDVADVEANVLYLEVLLNLAFNVTEAIDALKKNIYYKKPIDPQKMDSVLDAIVMTGAAARMMYKQSLGMDEETTKQVVRPVSEIMDPRYLHGVLGVFTEAGELLQTLGKQDGNLDRANVAEEIGDVMWYLALIEDCTGVDVEGSMDTVIAKLKQRYPDKFTIHSATVRDLDAERRILEEGIAPKTNAPQGEGGSF
jgi:NTP pyrophosphatase (non-canonical NTP hydrolase)